MSSETTNPLETVETRPLRLLIREKNRAYVTQFPYDEGTEAQGEPLPEMKDGEFSPTGEHIVGIEGEDFAAVIRDGTTGKVTVSCGGLKDSDTPLKVNFATFSPRGSYLLAWSRPVADVAAPNLVIYRVATGERMAAFHQKLFHVAHWPSIQWSDDESIAARSVTNTIHFFKGDMLHQAPSAKLGIPGVSNFALSHGSAPYTIASFVSGKSGSPGRIATFKHPDEGGEQLASRSTFRADSIDFKWNSKGTAVLSLVSTNVDTTGKSYYGESEAYFMDNLGLVVKRVDLPQEGPIYDAAWAPAGGEFIIIYGYMPSRATLFNEKSEPVFDFGTGSRNKIIFSPHGRFVALAGFGNLAGLVEFWDKNKMKLVGRTNSPFTTMHSWSPCSRYFLGATTFPRMRVDNGYRILRFDGKVIHEEKLGEEWLHQAVFKPALRGTYADPKLTMGDMIGGPVEEPAAASTANGGDKKKGGVYRPPGSKGTSSIKLHDHLEAGKVDKAAFMSSGVTFAPTVGLSKSTKKFVPGMDPALFDAPPSKTALARRRKKEREKLTKAQEWSGPVGPPPPVPTPDPQELTTVEAAEKWVKKLRKKKRAIEILKISKEEGKELNPGQLEKLEGGPVVAEDLEKLEKRLAELQA